MQRAIDVRQPAESDAGAGSEAGSPSGVADFDAIYRKYRGMVASTVRHLVSSPWDVEDLVQASFLEVYKSLPRFRGQSSLSTWIYRIAVNTALQEVRRRKRNRWLSLFSDDSEGERRGGEDPGARLESRSALRLLDQALQELSPKKRVVFVLVEIEGLRPDEAAEVVQVPINTVRSRLIAARNEVTAFLTQHGAIDG